MSTCTAGQGTVIAEALAIVARARADNVGARLLGGVGVNISAGDGRGPFQRSYQDIDIYVPRGRAKQIDAVLRELGYAPDHEFNALHGARRLLYMQDTHRSKVDVFVGKFAMCHELPIRDDVDKERPHIPLAELLLTKLQVVELNTKDAQDICSLLYHHPFGQQDGQSINELVIGELCGSSWGLWRTASMNAGRVRALRSMWEAEEKTIAPRLGVLEHVLETAHKSRRWKWRSRVGDRLRWYEEPEEVNE